MTITITWTAKLSATVADLVTKHHNPDIVSRAREIYHGTNSLAGKTLTPLNVEFITAMRSRFGMARHTESTQAEDAFDHAWGEAWDAAKAAQPPQREELRLTIEHAQKRDGRQDDPALTDTLRAVIEGDGVYFTGTPTSNYRWGCSRTYKLSLNRALAAFMYENGQTLVSSHVDP